MNRLDFANRIAGDKNFRAQLRKDAKAALQQLGMDTGDAQVKIVEDSASVHHIAMPEHFNTAMEDGALDEISAGGWNPFIASSYGELTDAFGTVGDAFDDLGHELAKIEKIKDLPKVT